MSPPNTSPNGDARVYPRKPPRATLEQKIRILDYFHRLDRPQLETVDNFRNEVAISTLTFNEWLKNEQEYRQRYRELGSQFEKHARRKVTYKYDKINRAMDLLVQQRLSRGEEVTEPVLRNYWQIYAHQFGVENPKRLIGFSHGWLSQFKKRHGLGRANQGSVAGGINSGTASGTTATTSITTGTGTTTTGITPNTTVTNTAAPLLHVHGDVTTSNNEKLLADPASEDELGGAPTHLPQHQPQRQHQHQRQLQEPAGHFQPQRTLSFPQNLAYLPPASPPRNRLTERHPIDPINGNRNVNVNVDVDVDVDVDELAELLARAMQLSLNTRKPFDAHDIEHFLVTVADRFFQDHQYDYPQTVHLYEEFKSLFASERLINLRSSQDRVPVLVLTPGQVLVPVSGPGPTPLKDSRAPRSSSLALIPQSLALAHGPQMALAALLILDQPGLRSLHGLRSRSRSRTRASSLGPSAGHGTGLTGQHLPGDPLALRHSHMHLRQQLQHQQHQIQHQHQHHHQQQHQHQHQHQHQEQQVLQQVQQTQLQQTQLQQNQHVYQLEQTNPLDADEQSMDNIFLRQARHKQRAFTGTGTGTGTGTSTGTGEEAWLNSELRKLWEQNKLMLS